MREGAEPPVAPGPFDRVGSEHDVVVGHDRRARLELGEDGVDLDLERAEGRLLAIQLDPGGGDVLERIGIVHDVGGLRGREGARRLGGLGAAQRHREQRGQALEAREERVAVGTDESDDGGSG